MNQAATRPPRTSQRAWASFRRAALLVVAGLVALVIAAAVAPTTRWARGGGYLTTVRNIEVHAPEAGVIESVAAADAAPVHEDDLIAQIHDASQTYPVHAAMSGTLYLHRYQVGDYVKPEDALGQIFDQSAGWIVRIQLNERVLPSLSLRQTASISITAHGVSIPGVVSHIDSVITPRATGDGVFAVDLTLDPPADLPLEPGMTATAAIAIGRTTWLRRLLDLR